MANVQISDLVADTSLANTDVIAKEDASGVATKKITWASIKTLLETAYSVLNKTIGIADNNLLEVDDADAADDDYARFTANGLEGRSPTEVRGDLQETNTQTGTTYTTVDGDNGKVITLNNASAITLTIHQAAAAGFHCMIIQKGAGQVTIAAGGTGNVRNFDSHTKLAGQYAMGSIYVESNAGTAPEVYLSGNTGS